MIAAHWYRHPALNWDSTSYLCKAVGETGEMGVWRGGASNKQAGGDRSGDMSRSTGAAQSNTLARRLIYKVRQDSAATRGLFAQLLLNGPARATNGNVQNLFQGYANGASCVGSSARRLSLELRRCRPRSGQMVWCQKRKVLSPSRC